MRTQQRPGAREFVAFWRRDGVVTAAMHVNVWDVIDDLRAIVVAGRPVHAGRLGDASLPLADLVASGRR